MAEPYLFAKAIVEVLAIAIGGFLAGRLIYGIVAAVSRRLISGTKVRIDDILIRYIQAPIEAITTIISIYVFSGMTQDLQFIQVLMAKYSLAILALVGAYVASEAAGALLRWYYLEGSQKSKIRMDLTLLPFLRKFSRIAIWFIGLVVALSTTGLDVSGILTLTSVVALILGLASQESLANIFAGLALQLDRPYTYGEYLRFATGEVAQLQKIGLRSSKLADLSGNIMVISNSEFAKQRVVNLSRPSHGFEAKFQVQLPIKADILEFEKFITKQIGTSKIQGLKADSARVLLERLDYDKAILQVSVWITHYQNFELTRDFINRKALEFLKK
ncbi:MAG: mechanosensitive ion channel family protein [Candidatus Micrarchaeota archaeon]